jgi:hypothetical protein
LGIMLALLALPCVWGCEPTPYQRAGVSFGRGYSDKKLSEDTFHVSFAANYATSAETLREYLYRRAAELTSRYGFRYFAVVRPPRPLTWYKTIYPSQEDREAGIDGQEAELPAWGTLHMTIQCFRTRPDASGPRLSDAETCLLRGPQLLLERIEARSISAPAP